LENRVAIVTGGAGGIGAATARLFCEEGAAVALVDLPDAPLGAVADAIERDVTGARVLPVAVDLSSESAARQAVEATLAAFGAIDVLVNNAGIRAYEPLAEARADTWQRILSVNLLSYAYMAREALPALRARRGNIVNVSSQHAVHPRAGMGQYDVAKAGIVSMTRTLAWEEADRGVRVNAVCPGLTLTPFHVRRAAPSGRGEADLRAERVDNNLLRRWADAREIACPILWLASDEASFVNAAVLMADGGSR
jgi:NAD(P)-dependent dehydrogenase (short-subunit alcohol dehydrogenase family)